MLYCWTHETLHWRIEKGLLLFRNVAYWKRTARPYHIHRGMRRDERLGHRLMEFSCQSNHLLINVRLCLQLVYHIQANKIESFVIIVILAHDSKEPAMARTVRQRLLYTYQVERSTCSTIMLQIASLCLLLTGGVGADISIESTSVRRRLSSTTISLDPKSVELKIGGEKILKKRKFVSYTSSYFEKLW
jgi:hypothetical protein